ncbi:hypothetical protein EI427_17770 [Flammeovirga pectinis]|uniref:Uncharacterized protein n=1 Tax=Flammeovirga pectinis TaxID=2494373 RepID=A0A3Q9FSA4_9BACT|nr:hypothetical protein [Flammeovirga pectinis]AZQ64006.1 hypothetical protein EI427_17770 [Flammeovirga pectinis]
MNNLFDLKRFKAYASLEITYQKQLVYYGVAAIVSFIIVSLFFIRTVNENSISEDDLYGLFFVTYICIAAVVINRSFLSFRSSKKLISFLTFPVSQFEKFLFEYLSTVVVGVFVVPFLILFAYMVEGELHQIINPNIGYTGLDFITDVIGQSMIATTEKEILAKQLIAVMIVLIPWSIANVIFTGNSFFKKLPLMKSVLFSGLYIAFHVFLAFLIFSKMGAQEYITSDYPLFFFSSQSAAIVFIIGYILLANAVFVYSSYLKLKEKEI